ncbi:uncharacterized protein LOC135140258 [Zophobas morio]|uniref:uncharacterized protein LOC135140258 n=1 Tax=Zophobas morio TaxID=2755281 RepID=UPI0030831F21
MSSTMSSTEIQTIPRLFPHKMEEKRLVRTSSLEKIRRFNSFICSQQYYILPALLAWLRSSQSVLQSSTEKTIFFFRSLIFSHLLYKLYQVEFRTILSNVLALFEKQIRVQYGRITRVENLLRMGVVMVVAVLLTELVVCFYLLCLTGAPSGLVFLIVCCFYIIYLNVRAGGYVDKKSVMKKRN